MFLIRTVKNHWCSDDSLSVDTYAKRMGKLGFDACFYHDSVCDWLCDCVYHEPVGGIFEKERDTEKLFNISHLGLIDHINYRIDRDADTSTVYKSEFLYYEYYRRGTVDQ